MAPSPVAVPNILTNAGYLFIAPLASSVPANTVAGSVFTDAWPAAWLPLGATEDGSEFDYTTNVQPIMAAEFYDPVKYFTTDRAGSIAFALLNIGLTNYNRALNGGVAALAPTSGTGATALYTTGPTAVGSEVRCMIGWESLDNTMRFVGYQCLQGGQIKTAFKKPPAAAVIPCTFNLEVPASGTAFNFFGAGASRA